MARKRKQRDPYAEESTEIEDNDAGIEPKVSTEKKNLNEIQEIKPCGHAARSVNLANVKKSLNHGTAIGACSVCIRARTPLGFLSENGIDNQKDFPPVIWMCAFCGHQGCDRKHHKHALKHYMAPRSDPHYLAVNTQEWTVWCYKCDNEVLTTSCKKLDECLQHLRKMNEKVSKSTTSSFLAPKTNLTSQYSGSDSRLHLSSFSEESFRNKKFIRKTLNLESIPKAKGLMNLGNTCFFNSVMQSLSQTHFLTQLLEAQLQSGQKVVLPGRSIEKRENCDYTSYNGNFDYYAAEDNIELKPLELHLLEGGPLSASFSSFLKDMNSNGKYTNTVKPDQLFSVLCKKISHFGALEQQDAHELLRCFLDGIRNEEIGRMKRGILKAFALTEKTHFQSVNEKLRKLLHAYGLQASHTIIDDIFSGQLISTIICDQCHWTSQRFESFMDLSLPINEEKGRPKKSSICEDETVADYSGRRKNEKLSKHQLKKQKNAKKRGKNAKYGAKNVHQVKVMEDRRNRRLTEKRRPEDTEDLLLKLEEEQRLLEAKKKSVSQSKNESENFRKLVQQKSLQARHSSGEESEQEEMEYDEEDDDDDSFGTMKRPAAPKDSSSESSKVTQPNTAQKESPDEDETDDNANLSEDSSRVCQSKETSDADVEDNNDSDNANGRSKSIKRHPSIVIEESSSYRANGMVTQPQLDHRLLTSCGSVDLFSHSTSDTERYFTAAAGDTMDELDAPLVQDNLSIRSGLSLSTASGTSGKGDSISISSGEAFGRYDDRDKALIRNSSVDQITFQVNDMKIMSDSKDSLLDGCNYTSEKRGSADSFISFDEVETREELLSRTKKQWMSKSMDTLSPRYQTDRQECSIMSCLSNFTTPELLTGNNKISCDNCTRIRSEEDGEYPSERVKSSASKQLLILSPPAVLTLQLKRFQHVGCNLQKVNKFVQFPLVLDVAPFVSSISVGLNNLKHKQTEVLYALYGIVQHSGRLDNGHYVAYVRARHVDPTRLTRRFLNTKPSSEYEVEKLIDEMVQKEESIRKCKEEPYRKLDIEKVTEEVKMGRWFYVSDSHVSEVNIDKVMKAQAYLLFYERIL